MELTEQQQRQQKDKAEDRPLDVTEVPFNRFLGVKRAMPELGFVLELDDSPCFRNHLGTVHAGVQLAVGEASSGECLLREFPEMARSVLAVVRRLEAKFSNPINGKLMTKASVKREEADKFTEQMKAKGRGSIRVHVQVFGSDGTVGSILTVDWFIQKQDVESS